MTINPDRYVRITSGVGGANVIAQRALVGRLFSTNPLVPPQSVLSFTSADAVSAYFGAGSEEQVRASFYFGWLSKNFTRAQSIQFARWAQTAFAPYVLGAIVPNQNISNWTVITAGAFAIVIGNTVSQISGLNFSTDTTLPQVAARIQTAVRLIANPQLTTATVTWDPTSATFKFQGTLAQDDSIAIQDPISGTSIVSLLGWGPNAVVGYGSDAQTTAEALAASSNQSDNFGSFLFMPSLTISQINTAAVWNKGQNVKYLYTVPVSTANVSTYTTQLNAIGGTALTLSDQPNEYPEMIPMIIAAATDYTRPNAGQNYMFQQFPGLTPSVSSDQVANDLDSVRVNYYGVTQEAGQLIAFYQLGVLMGVSTDPLDMNTYVNEIWLKSAATAALLNFLIIVSEVSANERGRSQILAILQDVINQALDNGVISVGKTLTAAQRTVITELSQDPNAWYQVQTIGYWINCFITSSVVGGVTIYTAEYLLIYSKDDVIRRVVGTHVLI